MPEAKTQEELFDGLVEKVAARLGSTDKLSELMRDVVHEQVTKSTEALVAKNDELLTELRGQKQTSDDLAEMLKDSGNQTQTKDIILDRDAARDPRQYQAAKMQAEKAGVRLLIAGRNAPDA